MISHCLTIAKPDQGTVNEDAVLATASMVAVSDGAGGGGVFADMWASYLLDHLPTIPLTSFEELDGWIDGIWEPFFNDREHYAKSIDDAMLLSKFYEEGSFATLAAIWAGDTIRWATYGDSVAFHYDFATKILHSSIAHLSDFANAPSLISCKDSLALDGFACGEFDKTDASAYFVASDALAHYILMMYMVANKSQFACELEYVLNLHDKNSNLVKSALALSGIDFEQLLTKLLGIRREHNFRQHLNSLRRKHLLALDDYSLAVMTLGGK